MKPFVLAFLFASQTCLFGQGTIAFGSLLHNSTAVPPTGSVGLGNGYFSINDNNQFTGHVRLGGWGEFVLGITSVNLFESSNPALLGIQKFSFTPGPVEWVPDIPSMPPAQNFYLDIMISESDRASLMAGNWYANVATQEFPSGAIRGQIVPVPEPEVWALVGIGVIAVGASALRKSRFRHV